MLNYYDSPYKTAYNYQEKEQTMNKITDPKSLQFATGNFIVASVDKNSGFSIAQNPVIHSTAESARAECARLSKLNVNRAFTFLRICGGEVVEAQPTKVTF